MPPDLAKACEIVFQDHKFSAEPIPWNKDIFRGRLSLGMSEKAKETLLDKKVIYYPNKAKRMLTMINPEVVAATNFEEALLWVSNKKPILVTSAISVTRPVEKTIHVAKPRAATKEVSRPAQYVYVSQTDASKQHDTITELKWHLKPIYYYGLWLAAAAAMGALIAWLLGSIATVI